MITVIASLLFLGAFIIWWIYGKDEDVKEENVYDALNNIDIFDATLAYDGEAEDNDAVAILLHIINKKLVGFNPNKKTLSTDHNYKNAVHIESAFIEDLFGRNSEIRLSESKEKFCKAVKKLKVRLNEEKRKKKIFVWSSLTKGKFVFILFVLILSLAIFNPLLDLAFSGNILETLLFSIASIFLGIGLCYVVRDIGFKHVTVSFFAIMMLGFAGFELVKILFANTKYLSEFIICIILAIITYGLLKSITKRNAYGNKVFNKLISIKRYIELQESIQINASLLPFVYMLKIRKEDKFWDEEALRMDELAAECMNILNPQGIMKNESNKQNGDNSYSRIKDSNENNIFDMKQNGNDDNSIQENIKKEGQLVDFNGECIIINHNDENNPVQAELKCEAGENILNFIVKICFYYHSDVQYKETLENAVLDGIKLWAGKYEVFGGQKITVNISIIAESICSPIEFLLLPINPQFVNIIPVDGVIIDNHNKMSNKYKLGDLEEHIKTRRSFVLSPQGWRVENEKIMCLFSKDDIFSDAYRLKQVAKHEFGHVLGLGDLYEETIKGFAGVEKGRYSELDDYHLRDREYDLVMCRSDGEISNNDIEMVILAFSKNEKQNYQTIRNKDKISEALGKGN